MGGRGGKAAGIFGQFLGGALGNQYDPDFAGMRGRRSSDYRRGRGRGRRGWSDDGYGSAYGAPFMGPGFAGYPMGWRQVLAMKIGTAFMNAVMSKRVLGRVPLLGKLAGAEGDSSFSEDDRDPDADWERRQRRAQHARQHRSRRTHGVDQQQGYDWSTQQPRHHRRRQAYPGMPAAYDGTERYRNSNRGHRQSVYPHAMSQQGFPHRVSYAGGQSVGAAQY